MFFEVFEACVDDLLHTVHFGSQQLFAVVNVTVGIRESDIDSAGKIVQTLVVDEYTDKHGKRWHSARDKGRHQLIGNNHFVRSRLAESAGRKPGGRAEAPPHQSYQMNSFALSRLS